MSAEDVGPVAAGFLLLHGVEQLTGDPLTENLLDVLIHEAVAVGVHPVFGDAANEVEAVHVAVVEAIAPPELLVPEAAGQAAMHMSSGRLVGRILFSGLGGLGETSPYSFVGWNELVELDRKRGVGAAEL